MYKIYMYVGIVNQECVLNIGSLCVNLLVKINQQNEAIRPLKTKLNSYINNENTFDNPFSHKLDMNTTQHIFQLNAQCLYTVENVVIYCMFRI